MPVRKFRIGKWTFCVLLITSVFLFFDFSSLKAQDFPTKPINLVNQYPPGGSSELLAHTFLHLSTEIFGQPMVLQTKPGGGGAIGTEFVYQAKPDGYTLLIGHVNCNSVLVAAEGRSRGPGELEAVCRLNLENNLYCVKADSPFKTIKDMVDWAKANPGKLTFGNFGTWSLSDFEWRWLEHKAGIKTRNVPYTGGGPVTTALLGGHIQVGMLSSSSAYPQMRAGKLRALAISGSLRKADMPNIPTLKEEGYDTGLDGVWKGILAPKGTPRPIIEKLATGFKKMTENKQAIDNFAKLGNEFNYLGPDEFAKYWSDNYKIYVEMVKMFK
jgi:tripartite-type tricarboxylate transporter receptor subunit TctC